MASLELSCHYCPHYKPVDTVFSYLEDLVASQGRRWGTLLDAGTGVSSARWAMRLGTLDELTAVTISDFMIREVTDRVLKKHLQEIQQDEEGDGRAKLQVVKGDWTDASLLRNVTFDNILADYLVGAMDGYFSILHYLPSQIS